MRTIATDLKVSQRFGRSNGVDLALSPDMNGVYVSDVDNNSVTLMTLDGDVKAVYKDKRQRDPAGICVHKSGVVYVVGQGSFTVHQLDPVSGKFKLLNHGPNRPYSISYCDVEDKMYVGLYHEIYLSVFEMKWQTENSEFLKVQIYWKLSCKQIKETQLRFLNSYKV